MKAGSTRASGGTSHMGKVSTNAPSASTREKKVHHKLKSKLPPCLRCMPAKRRSATMRVSDGVIMNATASKDATTTKGVNAKITSKGATTVLRLAKPTPSNQRQTVSNQALASSQPRTKVTAVSQYK